MTDVAVGTLRIRGPHARRLASVAARALPAALDHALADVPDVQVPRVHVVLDLDVSLYDDVTLATLWADAIRAEVLGAQSTRRCVIHPSATPASGPAAPAGPDVVLAEARRRLAAPNGTECAVPASLLRLGDPETARTIAAALGPREWLRLLRSLSSALAPSPRREAGLQASRDPDPAPGARATSAAPPGVEGAPPDLGRPPGRPALHLPTGHTARHLPTGHTARHLPTGHTARHLPTGPTAPPSPSAEEAGRQQATLELLAVLGELMPPGSVAIDPAAVTRAAGLVLLYPWLPEHCGRAERLHPWLDPLDVREAALAALVAPDDPDLADDFLVGFLAGRADLTERRDRTRLPLAREAEVRESAAEVLASFVSLLPGFGGSSASFIRENWIARSGVLDLDRDPALLTAATHPLDVVLPRLPYPLGLLKLPWSLPLSVRFRP